MCGVIVHVDQRLPDIVQFRHRASRAMFEDIAHHELFEMQAVGFAVAIDAYLFMRRNHGFHASLLKVPVPGRAGSPS
ncbi:hypothetical protein D3C75_1202060 [compost metagenome]